jgi:hypothetical protein
MFEYVGGLESGLYIPTLDPALGIITTFPEGTKTPPSNPQPVGTEVFLLKLRVEGLYSPILKPDDCGTNITLPVGKRTAPLYAPPDIVEPEGTTAENVLVAGLNRPIFDAAEGTKRTRPSGKSKDPL